MLNEMAAEASRASYIATKYNDNNVAGLERNIVSERSPRSPEVDQISLVKQIDKLKREYGVKPAGEPEDSWETWMQSEVEAPELDFFSPFSKQEPKGPARGQSQTWQKEHLRSSDPLQREIEDLFEEPSSAPSRRSNRPQEYPSRPASFKSVFEQRILQKPQPTQPRSRAALSRSITSGPQQPETPSFQSQVQQWQQSRSRHSQSGSQPSGSQPSGSQPSGLQPAQSPPPGSQRSLSQQSQSQRSQSQKSQSQRSQPQQSQLQPQWIQQEPMQYKPVSQLRHRQQQRTNSWPRNQELQGFAAHSLSYVAEAPREESAPSVRRPVVTATYELDELPERSNQGKGKGKGKDMLSQAEEGRAGAGQDAAEDAEDEVDKGPKPFCSIRGRFVIAPFPGWKNWFSRRGDDA
ncbi:hypothetical protein TGAMA5MH_07389 [Trichoderma gamsii]|uniref:Uncharacterized protein n=1 Tax=Trichoderma gamsii TaxID=398673 RepID=A0A2K0T583_9HYPO|nr:hypothetical protein TGAMA5MH_07389 [Trichoderma gamsii]